MRGLYVSTSPTLPSRQRSARGFDPSPNDALEPVFELPGTGLPRDDHPCVELYDRVFATASSAL